MNDLLGTILNRRAIKVFDQRQISPEIRQQMLDAARSAPSSYNMQPYRFYWIESLAARETAIQLCMSQSPAATASALVVAVADIGSWKTTTDGQLAFMRTSGFAPEKIVDYEKNLKFVKWFFIEGWFGCLSLLKWLILRLVHLWKVMGMPPVSRRELFKWAFKNTSLACQNLMIAAEALGLNSCPMDGFDGLRLARFLGLSPRYHEIVMVIAIGQKSCKHIDQPQWRRPFEQTVTIL